MKITSTPQLKGLEGFDPKMAYGTVKKGGDYYNESGQKIKIMNNTQTEMGKISNLITDMTLKGATQDELARAVRHSMVVIDAEKHKLDYKKSEQDNGITALKKKYQAHENDDGYGGAATLISRAKSETSVLKEKEVRLSIKKPVSKAGRLFERSMWIRMGEPRYELRRVPRWQKPEMLGHFHLELLRKRRMRTMLIP